MDSVDREARLRAVQELRELGEEETADLLETLVSAARLWERVIESLHERVTPKDLDTYLLPSRGVSLTDTLLTVSVSSQDAKDWILHRFGSDLRTIIGGLGLPRVNIRFDTVPVTTEVTINQNDTQLPAFRIVRQLEETPKPSLDPSQNGAPKGRPESDTYYTLVWGMDRSGVRTIIDTGTVPYETMQEVEEHAANILGRFAPWAWVEIVPHTGNYLEAKCRFREEYEQEMLDDSV